MSSKKQTYVYVRSDGLNTSANNPDGTNWMASCCWVPGIQMGTDSGKGSASVSVPLISSQIELFDLLGCGTNANKKIKYHNMTISLKDYDNHVLPMQNVDANGNVEDYKDMVELPFMHEAAILYNLKLRHKVQKPYTRTGDIVFAVNPYQWYHNLYTNEKRAYYANRLVWDTNSTEDPRAVMEPHVYEVSALSYKGLQFTNEQRQHTDQSILVSGESGAGKTETVKICLNHIAYVQRRGGGNVDQATVNDGDGLDPVVRRVVESNPLLEAFGNAKTRRNDNSSRFGKYLQLQFSNNSSCQLLGSVCDVYLLEKNRVIAHEQQKERNFHIFYQLLASDMKTKYWTGLQNTNYESFKYVGPTTTTSIEGISDRDRFQLTIDALQLVNVIDDKLLQLMQSMCIVLILGNMTFQPSAAHGDDQASVQSQQELESLATLVGVTITELEQCFISRTLKTNKEVHKVHLNINQAKEACDAFAKEAYERSFLWLVKAINEATAATSNSAGGKLRTIGLLDIFGFESFPTNGFEQLCINYANEKLQQKFNQDIFANVKNEYEAEGIGLEDIYYDDNTDVLDLIEGRTGLLALLNEECVRPKGTDFDFVQKALQMNKESTCLIVNKTDRLSFAIHHYAGVVMYNANAFVIKNLDTLPTDLEDCMDHSTNMVIKAKKTMTDIGSSASSTEESSSSSSPNKRSGGQQPRARSNITAPTIWTKYKAQLTTLMRNLNMTQSRYIRCIKPNNVKKPLIMEHEPVIDQLRCAGVVAAITISRSCFPNRLPNSVVLARYSSQLDHGKSGSGGNAGSSLEQKRANHCKDLMDVLLKSKETTVNGKVLKAYVVGKTKTYFRSGALEFLESNRSRGHDLHAMTIQRQARIWLKGNKNRHYNQRRQQEELERAKRAKVEADRKAAIENEFENRRTAHKNKQNELQQKIHQIEQLMKSNSKDTSAAIASIEQQCRSIEETIEDMAGQHKLDMETELQRRKLEKARQEKILEQNKKVISMLKKENTKLRTKQEKVKDKLRDAEGNAQKIHDMHSSLSNLNDSFANLTHEFEGKNMTLKEEHDSMHKRNMDMIKVINEITAQYTITAESRQEYQKVMVKMLYMVQDQIKKRALQEEIVTAAFAAENNGKAIMEELNIETAGVSLDHYSNHGSSSNLNYSDSADPEY